MSCRLAGKTQTRYPWMPPYADDDDLTLLRVTPGPSDTESEAIAHLTAREWLARMSERDRRIMQLRAHGALAREIAGATGIPVRTVNHVIERQLNLYKEGGPKPPRALKYPATASNAERCKLYRAKKRAAEAAEKLLLD